MSAPHTWEPPRRPNARPSVALSRVALARLRDLWAKLPPETVAEIRAAIARLRKARSPRQAVAALEHEIGNLFENIAPTAVQHPLPVHTPARAYTLVAAAAGTAAAVEEIEAIAVLLPGTTVVSAPALPLVVAASFTALALEAFIAASLRVHMLQAAGREVDPDAVTRDVFRAMTGREDVRVTKLAAKALSRRMLRRWSRGIVPFVGIGYATWDAQKTIRAIARMAV